jgi:hypothetical protein
MRSLYAKSANVKLMFQIIDALRGMTSVAYLYHVIFVLPEKRNKNNVYVNDIYVPHFRQISFKNSH